jgi:hypothetical protein
MFIARAGRAIGPWLDSILEETSTHYSKSKTASEMRHRYTANVSHEIIFVVLRHI